MSAMPCGAKNTQVNVSKIPSLVIDVSLVIDMTELSPRGEWALEEGCVTGGEAGVWEDKYKSKRRAKNQEE